MRAKDINGKNNRSPLLEAVLFGGAGDFGMNMMVLKSRNCSLMLDAGSALPGLIHFGIQAVIPNIETLSKEVGTLDGIVLTHGHQDHIGAVPFIWHILRGNIYGTSFTLALLERILKEHAIAPEERLVEVPIGSHIEIGVFGLEFINVAHSLPGSVAVAVNTPAGTVLHTGDYKMNASQQEASATDRSRLAEIGEEGVLAMFADSTNALMSGYTPDEQHAYRGLERLFSTIDTRIFVTTFSSSINRVRTLFELARTHGRKVFLMGRSLINNVRLAERLGYLEIAPNLYAEKSKLRQYLRKDLLVIATGSQGEPRSALHQLATVPDGSVPLESGDVIAFSARLIPGNEGQLNKLVKRLVKRDIEVVQNAEHPIHVSGHGSQQDMKEMLSLVKPDYIVPIHGEHAQLLRHAALVDAHADCSSTAIAVQNGVRLCFDSNEAWFGYPIEASLNYIDHDRQICTRNEALLAERRAIAQSGLLIVTIGSRVTHETPRRHFQVTTHGLRMATEESDITKQVEARIETIITDMASTKCDGTVGMETEIRKQLRSLFRSQNRVCPVVLTVFTEHL